MLAAIILALSIFCYVALFAAVAIALASVTCSNYSLEIDNLALFVSSNSSNIAHYYIREAILSASVTAVSIELKTL